jgi:hypothetical protein
MSSASPTVRIAAGTDCLACSGRDSGTLITVFVNRGLVQPKPISIMVAFIELIRNRAFARQLGIGRWRDADLSLTVWHGFYTAKTHKRYAAAIVAGRLSLYVPHSAERTDSSPLPRVRSDSGGKASWVVNFIQTAAERRPYITISNVSMLVTAGATGPWIVIITVLSILFGAVLAWRFTVFVLIPAVALDLAVVVAAAVARGDDVWSIALAMVLSATGLQMGYLGGTGVLFAIEATHTTRTLPARLHYGSHHPTSKRLKVRT